MAFSPLKLNCTSKAQILLLFSDVNASPMLCQIVRNVQQLERSFRVIILGDKSLQICKELQQIGIEPTLISKKSKYGLLFMLVSVMHQIMIFRPATILASGQYATILGIFSATLLRVRRRIFIRHHSNFHKKNRLRFGIFADSIANSMATHIVAVSKVVRTILIEGENVNPAKVILIRNGIDIKRFSGVDLPREKSVSFVHRQVNIGVVSRMTGWKGVQYTIDAFIMLRSRYPNVHLRLVGAPSDSYDLIRTKLAKLNQSDYSIASWHPDILGFLQNLDLFVHVPIGPQEEAFGLVYIEALASRTPSIFTVSGVIHELPHPEKYAQIVPFEDSLAIFNAMVKILEGTVPNRESLPPEWLQQYSLTVMGEHYGNLLIEVK